MTASNSISTAILIVLVNAFPDGMGEICISDGCAGSYSVEIVTEYGECFVGDFEL